MCLITEQRIAKKAKEDMTVYKIMEVSKNTVLSHIYKHNYLYEKLYTTELIVLSNKDIVSSIHSNNLSYADHEAYNYYSSLIDLRLGEFPIITQGVQLKVITQGFHAYTSIKRADDEAISSNNKSIVKCTIPKGANYYADFTGLIVSDAIIIHKT